MCDQNDCDTNRAHAGSRRGTQPSAANETTECVVMPGTQVNKAQAEAAGLYREHNGQRFWLCCAACGPRFDADPARYAAL